MMYYGLAYMLQEHEDQMDCDQVAWYEARGGAQRTGLGVGYGYFDSDLFNTDFRADRWSRNYRDVDAHGQKRWTAEAENLWEQNLADNGKAAQEAGDTYKLFKAR